MATYLYTLEGEASGATSFVSHRHNHDSGVWSNLTAPPIISPGMGGDYGHRLMGGWDGAFWYVILPDGKLYRYNPVLTTWSSALAGGAVVIPGTVGQSSWGMCSDGRFLYIYSAAGFQRYDPENDLLIALTDLVPGTLGNRLLVIYDGFDAIYIYRGDSATTTWGKYSISGASWSTPAAMPGGAVGSDILYGAFLQGKLWVIIAFTQQTSQAFSYNPSGDTWASHSTYLPANGITALSPFGEINDSTIRIWCDSVPGVGTYVAVDYNIIADTWAAGPSSLWNYAQGGNWAVSRVFSPAFVWYKADGTTPAPASVQLGVIPVGEVVSYHFRVRTPVTRTLGVTVSVPNLPLTDAEAAVTICATADGTYGTSFSTGGLVAGQFFDVFVKVAPTADQTLGLTKTFNLKVVAN